MTVNYQVATLGDDTFVVVVGPDGGLLTATKDSHSNFDAIVKAAIANDTAVYDMFDTGRAISKKFANVSDGRVSVRDGAVYFDDDLLDNAIVKQILGFHEEGESFAPLARYVENVMANPQEHSREQFYRWIENHHFPIADDGTIVAYKSVYSKGDGTYTSVSAGHAFVNGVEFGAKGSQRIVQTVGDVVTMPRSEVAHDPNVACHTGLHAGTWEYASTFSGDTVMLVKINPRDVVSVPHDCTSQKVRVCRYEVIGFAEDKSEALRYVDSVAEGDADVAEAEAAADPDDTLVDVPVSKVDGVFNNGDPVVIKYGRFNNRETDVFRRTKMDAYVGKRGVVRDDCGRDAHYVYVGGEKVAFWDDELQHDPQGSARTKTDTRTNHLRQKRGPGGRFLPKGF